MRLRNLLPAFLTLVATGASAASIVVIQGNRTPFGKRYFSGFSSYATEKVLAFQYEGKKEKALLAQVQKIAPDLVLTIGEVPLANLVAAFPATPFIVGDYYATGLAHRANVVMMESELPVGTGLALLQGLLPNRKTIGTIYDPKYSQGGLEALTAVAAKAGMTVASIKVDTAADVAAFLPAFTGKVDLIYCMRDATTSDPAAAAQLFAFAQQNNLPVVSLDPDHIQKGALLTVAVDPLDLGEQAWNVAKIILKESKIPQMPVAVDTREMTVSVSMKALARFGVGTEGLSGFLQKTTREGYTVKVEP